MRAIVVYDTWYGGTRKVAEEIARGIAVSLGIDPGVVEVDHAAPAELRAADLVVVGTPNHFGGPTRKILTFVRELREGAPLAGTLAVFDTCFAGEAGKAAAKLAELLGSLSAPGRPAPSQLSILVEGTRGPLRAGELARAHAFGRDLAKLVRGGRIAVPV
jgi:flavorubredoxin